MCCLIVVACCLLRVVRCVLSVACCLLRVVGSVSLLLVVCCLLLVFRISWLLAVAYSVVSFVLCVVVCLS